MNANRPEYRCTSFNNNLCFVPFVAIPGNDPPAESCKRLNNSSIILLVFIRVHSWFVVFLCGLLLSVLRALRGCPLV